MAGGLWRVRTEDDAGEGRAVSLERLGQGLEDGVWGENDQARGPGEARWTLIGEHPRLTEFVPPQPLFHGRSSEEAEMDMTPMIDVTFQLLIFFMIAATCVVQKTLDMPRAEAQEEEGASTMTMNELKEQNIIVKVGADSTITVGEREVALSDLTEALVAAVAENPNQHELALDIDDQVDHETVVAVLDAAGGAKIEKVHLISRASPAGE